MDLFSAPPVFRGLDHRRTSRTSRTSRTGRTGQSLRQTGSRGRLATKNSGREVSLVVGFQRARHSDRATSVGAANGPHDLGGTVRRARRDSSAASDSGRTGVVGCVAFVLLATLFREIVLFASYSGCRDRNVHKCRNVLTDIARQKVRDTFSSLPVANAYCYGTPRRSNHSENWFACLPWPGSPINRAGFSYACGDCRYSSPTQRHSSEQLSRAELRKPLLVTKGIFLKVIEDSSVTSLPAAQEGRRVRILSKIN